MASLQSQLVELKEFESGAVSFNTPCEAIKAILRASALACVVLLLLSSGFAQKVVTARASIPFNFWAQGREFQAGDYVFDNSFPGSATIHREGSHLSVAIPVILYAAPVDKEDPTVLFVRRDGKYYLVEIWGVGGRRVVTSEFEHRGEVNDQQRQVTLTLVEPHNR